MLRSPRCTAVTEGFTTPDVIAARELLESLAKTKKDNIATLFRDRQ